MKELERSLGLPSVVAISIGAMLGGEIFLLPAVAAAMTGASLWLAYLLAAVLVIPAALTKAELSTAIPSAGGSYLFVERAMGPMAGTIAGLGLWLSLLLKSAFALAVLGSYLALAVDVPTAPVAMALLLGVVVLNIVGVRKVGKVQTVIVGACLLVLVALVMIGAPQIERLHLLHATADSPPWLAGGVSGLLAAVGLVFISYAGVTKIAAIAEEVRDEARNIPLGIVISLLVIALVYTLVAWVLAGIFDPAELASDETPLATLAREIIGPVGIPLVVGTAFAALVSMANAGLLAASRFPFAMARDHLAPSLLHRVHRRYMTPHWSIVLTGTAMAAIVLLLDVVRIAKLASAFMIAAFVTVQVAIILFRESKIQWYEPRFRAPLYPMMQGVGIVTGLLILVAMGMVALWGLVAIGALGVLLYVLYGRTRASRLGILKQILWRKDLVRDPSRTGAYKTLHEGRTIVALVGGEPSAEALVQIGMTLAGPGGHVDVLALREVPEQMGLTAMLEPDDRMVSLERRVLALAAERGVHAELDVIVTRDVRRTLYERANRLDSRWVVMAWRETDMRGHIVRDPMEWLMARLPCNLAVFRDAGIRTYRHLMVVAEPGPHDALVAHTADDLASLFRADVAFVNHTATHDGDAAAATAYGEQMRALCHSETKLEVLSGSDDVADLVKASARFDLVVLGAPPEKPLRSMFVAAREERIVERAHCAVLRLKTPRAEVHRALRTAGADRTGSVLIDRLVPEAVAACRSVAKKDRLFSELAAMMAGTVPHMSAAAIEKELREREAVQTTAMGHGMAIPHATVAGLPQTFVGVMTLTEPIAFAEGADEEPVDVCFCLLGPPSDRASHLRLLAAIAGAVMESDLLERMRAAESTEALLEALSSPGPSVVPG
ncbi:amino acid permease [Paraliomyxa miuraensis]|uniref:amino acid permease n=1 Tax=Paraliomyxa miuraensis TaxID=376150 RepID=UPI002253FDB9|nr:amino acid permease [Paraliomyxa miuraensis]MCX4247913.1 amino acid permease [Paraliomyxa miuraensis]